MLMGMGVVYFAESVSVRQLGLRDRKTAWRHSAKPRLTPLPSGSLSGSNNRYHPGNRSSTTPYER